MTPDERSALLERIHTIPIVETLQLEILHLEDDVCDVRVPHVRKWDGVYQSFHGGLLMTVADTAACFAAFTRAGADAFMTTTDMNIRFLAPCLSDLTARARLIKFGRSLCPVHVDLFDAEEKHVAVAQVSYLLLDRIPHGTPKKT
jgi:uncharacterized protein (TIGR00369 family)